MDATRLAIGMAGTQGRVQRIHYTPLPTFVYVQNSP